MNWKGGLFRLWVIVSSLWVVAVFIEVDGFEKISYAWRYYTQDGGLHKEKSP